MNLLGSIRGSIGLKLFLSYVVVILIGATVLSLAAELTIPRVFTRHMAGMESMMGPMMEMGPMSDVYTAFRRAVNEAMFLGALASSIAAVLAAVVITRRMVRPVEGMTEASQRIAHGDYEHRVSLPGDQAGEPEEMDELARLAVSFNQMAEKLDKTEEMRRALIGDVAHELRTPLSTIKGSMEGLMDGVVPATQETFRRLHREADRMQHLVQDLQELSRVEAGAYDLDLTRVSARDLVGAAGERLDRQYEQKGVRLEIDVPSDLPRAEGDEGRLEQVLLNLLGNALQYTPTGGEVVVRAERGEEEITVSISDTGIGIPKEHLPRVFNRFYRLDKSRSRAGGGSGIGLTIAKHIVERHGGEIWAESEGVGHGSTFHFTLPLSEGSPSLNPH